MNTGIFYGTTTGNTEIIAEIISNHFENCEIDYIENLTQEKIKKFDLIIFGIPTWNIGELEASWEEFFPELVNLNFLNTIVAIYGLGDQFSYEDTFQDAMGILYDQLVQQKAIVIGSWPISGYSFSNSLAVKEGKFVGLALDVETQDEKTESRIDQWIVQIKSEFQQVKNNKIHPISLN